jgi:hypothetical protein
MKFNIALLSAFVGLATAAPASDASNSRPTWKRQYNTGTVRPSFTHVWTDKPGLGFFKASSTGHIRFGTTETDQTFQPDTSLRGQSAIVGFDLNVPRDDINDGTEFQVFLAQEDLVLEKDKDKPNTNNKRGTYVARFFFEDGVPKLAGGESGKFKVPDKTQFTLQVVGSNGAEFEFNAAAGEGLTIDRF